jgi:hypothetical protein
MSVYIRIVTCSKGHLVRLAFEWTADGIRDPEDFSKACPVSGCDGLVTGKLPSGTVAGSARLGNGAE